VKTALCSSLFAGGERACSRLRRGEDRSGPRFPQRKDRARRRAAAPKDQGEQMEGRDGRITMWPLVASHAPRVAFVIDDRIGGWWS